MTAVGVLVFAVAGVLLVSFGGAIFAAPLTLPAMYLIVRRHPTTAFKVAAIVIGGLTLAEVAWAAAYVATN